MTTETAEIPQGVMQILRKRADAEVEHWLKNADDESLAYVVRECVRFGDGRTVPGYLRWLRTQEITRSWLSGLNAMRLA